MKADPTYSLDGIQSDVGNLHRLLDTVFDPVMDMDFGKENGTRNHKLDRVAALAQIARDLAESLDERIDANFHIIMKGIEATSERGVRQRERCSHLKRNKQIRQARHGSPWRTFPCRTHV